jgi:hypothetical protein
MNWFFSALPAAKSELLQDHSICNRLSIGSLPSYRFFSQQFALNKVKFCSFFGQKLLNKID